MHRGISCLPGIIGEGTGILAWRDRKYGPGSWLRRRFEEANLVFWLDVTVRFVDDSVTGLFVGILSNGDVGIWTTANYYLYFLILLGIFEENG